MSEKCQSELWSDGDLQRQKPHIAVERSIWLDAPIRELLQLAAQLMKTIGLAQDRKLRADLLYRSAVSGHQQDGDFLARKRTVTDLKS
jgi:hypothetical protein